MINDHHLWRQSNRGWLGETVAPVGSSSAIEAERNWRGFGAMIGRSAWWPPTWANDRLSGQTKQMFNQNDVRPCWAIRYDGFNPEEVACGNRRRCLRPALGGKSEWNVVQSLCGWLICHRYRSTLTSGRVWSAKASIQLIDDWVRPRWRFSRHPPCLVWAEGNRIDPKKLLSALNWTEAGSPLSESMPQHDWQPSEATNATETTVRLNLRIRFAYNCDQLGCCSIADVRFAAQTNPLVFTYHFF
jgi:hypothetical protein